MYLSSILGYKLELQITIMLLLSIVMFFYIIIVIIEIPLRCILN